jgi:hypothetical protein
MVIAASIQPSFRDADSNLNQRLFFILNSGPLDPVALTNASKYCAIPVMQTGRNKT